MPFGINVVDMYLPYHHLNTRLVQYSDSDFSREDFVHWASATQLKIAELTSHIEPTLSRNLKTSKILEKVKWPFCRSKVLFGTLQTRATIFPPACKVSREVANLTEITCIWRQRIGLSVFLSVCLFFLAGNKAAVSIISIASYWLGRIGMWGGRTGFRA